MELLTKIQLMLEMHGVIFSAIIGIILLFSKETVFRGGRILSVAIFVNMWLLICDAISVYIDGKSNIFATILIYYSNYSVFLLEYFLIAIIILYIYAIVRSLNPDYPDLMKKIVYGLMIIDTILLMSNRWTHIFFYIDQNNVYHRTGTFWISMALPGLSLGAILIILKQNWNQLKKNERFEILLFIGFPAVGAICQLFMYGISFVNLGITISVFIAFAAYMIRLRNWRKKKDLLILQSQAYLLNSQIKPHFLFNCLNVIQSLIEEDPDTAVTAVARFSKFLRTGLKIEIMDSMIPIQTELNYVEDYLYLEILRHGNKINVVRNYDCELDFEVPFLTLQPIVENAVRHGICKRIKGGTVAIDIKKVPEGHLIRVVDDGVGYLPIEKEKEWNPGDAASSGVGSVNVRNRLAMMCNGTLEVDSVPGKGTMVTIMIPG